MIIETKSDEVLYITINVWLYYIDDSTGEQIIDKWKETEKE